MGYDEARHASRVFQFSEFWTEKILFVASTCAASTYIESCGDHYAMPFQSSLRIHSIRLLKAATPCFLELKYSIETTQIDQSELIHQFQEVLLTLLAMACLGMVSRESVAATETIRRALPPTHPWLLSSTFQKHTRSPSVRQTCENSV